MSSVSTLLYLLKVVGSGFSGWSLKYTVRRGTVFLTQCFRRNQIQDSAHKNQPTWKPGAGVEELPYEELLTTGRLLA